MIRMAFALGVALVLFLIPVNAGRGEFLLDWKTAVTIPWDIIILFGGGFALAQGFNESGLTPGWRSSCPSCRVPTCC